MRILSILLVFIVAFTACKKESNDNFKGLRYNKGRYTIIGKQNGQKAKLGEYIQYSVLMRDNHNKVFVDKRKKNELLREQVLRDTVFMKDLTAAAEVLYNLTKGDSALLYIPLSDDDKTADLKNSDTLFFELKVHDILDAEKMRDIVEDEYLKQEAEETEARIKQIAADQTIMKAWDDYNKGKLKGKLKKTKSGIKYLVLEDGKGDFAKIGQKVKFGFYGMTQKDANAFENSFGRNKDLTLIVGAKQVMPGWDEALQQMNEDMKAVFFIPAKLGFGKKGKVPVIPPDADLVFYIELHKIIK